VPKTIPDFLGSRQYTSSTTAENTKYLIWEFLTTVVIWRCGSLLDSPYTSDCV
jgi:hypothetical protein